MNHSIHFNAYISIEQYQSFHGQSKAAIVSALSSLCACVSSRDYQCRSVLEQLIIMREIVTIAFREEISWLSLTDFSV